MPGRTLPVIALLGLGLVAACGTAPERPSERHRVAVETNQRAVAAFQRGDVERAHRLFEQALAADRSIENVDGVAVNLIALARVRYALGDTERAHGHLDEVLADGPLAFPPARRAEAAARKSLVHLAQGEAPAAAHWAARAADHCGTACPAIATITNLQARSALAAGSTGTALALSARALELARDRKDREEEANALRVAGEARLAEGNPAAARAPLAEALALDQRLGLPHKVRLDLLRLAAAERAAGNVADARRYLERAILVSTAARDQAGLAEANALLEQVR